jgi:hypothetical protein
MPEQWRVYAFATLVIGPASEDHTEGSVWYQTPGITFARSKREAVSKAFRRAQREYPESEGYSDHRAVVQEVTHDFLDLANRLSPLPKKDPRRGEQAAMGETIETSGEITVELGL